MPYKNDSSCSSNPERKCRYIMKPKEIMYLIYQILINTVVSSVSASVSVDSIRPAKF